MTEKDKLSESVIIICEVGSIPLEAQSNGRGGQAAVLGGVKFEPKHGVEVYITAAEDIYLKVKHLTKLTLFKDRFVELAPGTFQLSFRRREPRRRKR